MPDVSDSTDESRAGILPGNIDTRSPPAMPPMGRALLLLAGGTAVSKLTGVLRELLFAAFFGTGAIAAAFRISQTAFLMPTHALVGDTLSAGLLPLYKKLDAESKEAGQALVIVAFAFALLLSLAISTGLTVASDTITGFIAPGTNGDAFDLASKLLKVTAWAAPFYILGNFLGFVEAAHGRYGAISARPMLINLVAIVGALAAWSFNDPRWLAYATTGGFGLFFLVTLQQLFSLRVIDLRATIPKHLYASAAQKLWLNNAPLLALPFIAQCNVLVERMVSSHLGTSVVPGLDYAKFITETATTLTAVPLGIIAMSVHGGSDGEAAQENLRKTTKYLLLFSLPVSAFLFSNADMIVKILFQRGAFNAHSAAITSQIVAGGAIGLAFTIVAYFLVKGLNAQLRNLDAIIATALAVAANSLFDLLAWRQLGPLALGLGATLYGAVLFATTMTQLKLWRSQAAVLAWLVFGAACSCTADLLIPPFSEGWIGFAASASLFTLVWAGLFSCVKTLREPLVPIASALMKKWKRTA
ncbi:murein biosynthesis integral membrane protein MurJ [Caulobacter segnis]